MTTLSNPGIVACRRERLDFLDFGEVFDIERSITIKFQNSNIKVQIKSKIQIPKKYLKFGF
jgi:hypothetical protein